MMHQTSRAALLAGLLLSLAACSGGSGGSGQASNSDPVESGPPDQAPTSLPSVTLDTASGSVASGGSTTLNWTSINADSCEASGSWTGNLPPSGNQTVGPLTSNSTFSVTCSNLRGSAIVMVTVSISGELSLNWVAPAENVDGSALTDLAGYRIYYGERSRDYSGQEAVNDPDITSISISAPAGSYYVAMTAIDTQGNESGYSNEVLKTTD